MVLLNCYRYRYSFLIATALVAFVRFRLLGGFACRCAMLTNPRNASFTDSESGKSSATSGANTTILPGC